MQTILHKRILDNLPEGICIIEKNGKIIFWNKSAEKILGYSENETIGKHHKNFIQFPQSVHSPSDFNPDTLLRKINIQEDSEIKAKTLIHKNKSTINIFMRIISFPGIHSDQALIAFIFNSNLKGLELSEVSHQKHLFSNIIGHSQKMKELFNKVFKIAKSEVPVMVIGESGTGKELLARAIHAISNRTKESFITLDCHALPLTLLESELFGYEKGAFTGANSSKIGLLELSHKGTIFLDEVTEMDLSIQAKLLRFLQERKFRRIGGRHEKSVDVRIISATNKNPHEQISKGLFREDFFYRLGVVELELPPLRERREDIPHLVHAFIKKYGKQIERKCEGITKTAMGILKDYHWPGNVRQLENIIYRAIVMTDRNIIDTEDLPDFILSHKPKAFFENINAGQIDFKQLKRKYIEQFEKQFLEVLIKKHKGNITKVASEAGLSRVTIYRMLGLHNINLQIQANDIYL